MNKTKFFLCTRLAIMILLAIKISACSLVSPEVSDYDAISAILKEKGMDHLITEYVSDYGFDVLGLNRLGNSYYVTDIFVFNHNKSVKQYYFFPNDPHDTTKNAKALLRIKFEYNEYGINALNSIETVRPFAIIQGVDCYDEEQGKIPGMYYLSSVDSGQKFLLFPIPFVIKQEINNYQEGDEYIEMDLGNFPLSVVDIKEIRETFKYTESEYLYDLLLQYNYPLDSKSVYSISSFREEFSLITKLNCLFFYDHALHPYNER